MPGQGSLVVVAGLTGASFILVSLVVGARLLLLARRTRQLPELTVGLAFFLMGGFAWPMLATAQQATALPDAVRTGLAATSTLLMAVGQTSLAIFTWRVFRPEAGWARALVVGLASAFVVCALGQAASPGYAALAIELEPFWLSYQILPMISLGWTGLESLRYARVCARRQRVGLAEPIVTNRFLLWGACALTCTVLTIATTIGGPAFQGSVAGLAFISPVTLAAALALWFAFLPPASYRRWLARPAS